MVVQARSASAHSTHRKLMRREYICPPSERSSTRLEEGGSWRDVPNWGASFRIHTLLPIQFREEVTWDCANSHGLTNEHDISQARQVARSFNSAREGLGAWVAGSLAYCGFFVVVLFTGAVLAAGFGCASSAICLATASASWTNVSVTASTAIELASAASGTSFNSGTGFPTLYKVIRVNA